MTHVLLVDDESVLLDLESRILEKKYGFTTDTAISGDEALEKISSQIFDAIVSDYAMPGMDGLELLKRVRETDNQIPFILFSAKEREEVAIQALNNGANFFVQKEKNPSVAFAELSHNIHKSVELARAEHNLLIQRDLAIACSSSRSLNEILVRCLDAALTVSQMDAGAIYLLQDPGDQIFLAEYTGFSEKYADLPLQDIAKRYIQTFLKTSRDAFRDYTTIQNYSPILVEKEGIRSDAILCITHHNRHIGVIHVASHTNEKSLSPAFRRFLVDIVVQISSHISDRQAENALRESERKMTTLIKNLPGMVYKSEFDDERTMEVVSDGSKVLTGYSPEALIRNQVRSYASLIHLEDLERTRMIIRKAVEKKNQYRLNYRISHPNSGEKWVWEQGTGVYDESGNVTGLEGFVIDITRQKILDDQVKISQQRLNMLFSHMNSGCAIFRESPGNHDLILIDLNEAGENIEGRKKEELIGRSFFEIFNTPSDQPVTEALSGLLKDGLPRTLPRISYESHEGQTWREAYMYSTVTGGVREVFLIMNDVTGRINDEQKIIQNLREKELLLKEVHHRVKNNLQIISGILKLQAYRTDDPITQDIIQKCRDQVFSMASIHEQLYNSRDIGKIQISGYIENMVQNLKQEYGSATERIEFRVQTDQSINLDIERSIPCGLILNELITNAVKYAFDPGTKGIIIISLIRKDNHIILEVADNGKGLPPDFETKSKSSMGMELVNRLTHQLKGKITFSGKRGTEITVSFSDEDTKPEKAQSQ